MYTHIFPQDIINKLHKDFPHDYDLVMELLSEWYKEMIAIYEKFNENRITSFVVYYANGDINRLDIAIQQAKTDWRDTIVAAEYDRNDRQVRDMNKAFTII